MHEVDLDGKIVKMHILKEDIEQVICCHNTTHFQEAHQTEVYNDKIYHKLQEDDTRDKILDGRLREEDCDSKDVFEFLSLLKQPQERRSRSNRQYQEIMIEQWTKEVMRAKKRSASSLFSR